MVLSLSYLDAERGETTRLAQCKRNIEWWELLNNYIIILVTAKDKQEAEKITQLLLNERLIACGNIVNPVTSFFHWSGKIDTAEECLIVMKSRADLFSQVAERVKSLHSYEVPEVLALPIVDASKAYLDWMSVVLHKEA